MKRSHAPIFWLLFGAGGMIAALIGVPMVWISGFDAAFGLLISPAMLSFDNMRAFAQDPFGKLFLFITTSLFAWHAMHRIFHSLHDVGIPAGTAAKLICYGGALTITITAGTALLLLPGFN